MGKTKKLCNDCKHLKIKEGKFVCTAQRNMPEIKDIFKPCPIAGLRPVGCEYCRGEINLLANVWLEENTNHPKDEPDILLLCSINENGTTVKKRIPYCPMCKRKFI